MIDISKVKTIYLDFDSTLSTIEGIDELAKMRGVFSKIKTISKAANDGTAPFSKVFQLRLDIIKPTQKNLQDLAIQYLDNLTPGAHQLVSWFQDQDINVSIVSGGYTKAILPSAKLLGIPPTNVHAVTLGKDESGFLTRVTGNQELTTLGGKNTKITSLKPKSISCMIGDGASDVATKPTVDYVIAFSGVVSRSIVIQSADYNYSNKNLYNIKDIFIEGEQYARHPIYKRQYRQS